MDNTIIIYLFKASISITLFYTLFYSCFRGDTFLNLKRFYFLFAISFSLLFPFFTYEIYENPPLDVQIPSYWFSQIEVNENTVDMGYKQVLTIQNIVAVTFLFVSLLLTVRFIAQLLNILKIKANNESEEYFTCHIIKINDSNVSPFSFFRWIFISPKMYDKQDFDEIIMHEQIHAQQLHSIDVLLAEIVCICFWWNPIVWLMKHEIKVNLEYLADRGVVNAGFDLKAYQYTLLQVSNKNTGISIINNLNVSQLKKRITMMNKKKSSILTSVKYLLAIPISIVLLLGNAVQASSSLMDAMKTESSSLNQIVDLLDNQTSQQKKNTPISIKNGQKDKKGYFTIDQMPQYSGGESAMYKFINENLKYPTSARTTGIEGRVIARFIVSKDGSISDVTLIRGLHPECDAEAVRVIKAMPKWIPGKQNGNEVPVYFTLPIAFRLKNKKDEVVVKVAELREATTLDKDKPFTSVDQMPQYPGGESAMYKFIHENLKYPASALKEGIQGRVTIRFVVNKTGELSDVTLLRGINAECDAEAIRVIKSMPRWIPGKQNGIDAPVFFTLPILFRVKSDSKLTEQPKINDSNTLIVVNGKIQTTQEIANLKVEDSTKEIKMLSEIDGVSKYGDVAKGKKVIEVTTN